MTSNSLWEIPGHQILSRHHSISHVFDSRLGLPTPGSKGQQNMAKLLFEDFRTNFHQAGCCGKKRLLGFKIVVGQFTVSCLAHFFVKRILFTNRLFGDLVCFWNSGEFHWVSISFSDKRTTYLAGFRPMKPTNGGVVEVMPDVDDDAEYERRLAALFAACDAHQDGAVDQEALFLVKWWGRKRGLEIVVCKGICIGIDIYSTVSKFTYPFKNSITDTETSARWLRTNLFGESSSLSVTPHNTSY